MSKPISRVATCALVLALVGASAAAAVPEPSLDVYQSADGTPYFALSLAPNVALADQGPRDVVVLFDTSASQTGLVREAAQAALRSLLQGLDPADRVRLMAVDLDAVPLSKTFAAANSDETRHALAALAKRVPLGATDMPSALRAAAAAFDVKSARPRVVVYIGDGYSSANFMNVDRYRELVAALADQRISVSSFGVGLNVDGQLLASLANLTGGVLAIEGEKIDPKQVGAFLAKSVRGSVLWPTRSTWPKEFAEVYPSRMPPLRSDRDTIVVGKATAELPQEVQVSLAAQVGAKSQPLRWTLKSGQSNPDLSFLPLLVETARGDDGLRLVTVGTAGLGEARRMLAQSTELLATLSRQALVSGNLETAERLADEALRRDPNDEAALSVKERLAEMKAGAAVAAQSPPKDVEGELKVKRFSNEQAAPPAEAPPTPPTPADENPFAPEPAAGDESPFAPEPAADAAPEPAPPTPMPPAVEPESPAPAAEPGTPAPAPSAGPAAPAPAPVLDIPAAPAFDAINDGEGRLLENIEQHNRLMTDMIRTEVDHTLREAAARMETDPAGVQVDLKSMLGRVLRSPELRSEVRAQLRSRLEAGLREAARREATADILQQQRDIARGAAQERLAIADALARKQTRIQLLMERFNSLMEEGRYLAADEIGDIEMARIAPELPISRTAGLVAHMTGAHQADLALRLARQKAVIDTLGTVEVSMMPFPDDQPVVYPPADIWQELTFRRKKFAATDLKTVTPIEKKIRDALESETKMDFVEMPLQDAVIYLKDYHGIEIQLDSKALEDLGLGSDTPVTLNVNGISLKSGLRLLLKNYDLTYIIENEVLLITTQDRADSALVPKAYPVADLVIPVQSLGGGMMGGGMMGGGMMGGMGGGMGGGMMGGMGGGMGGGMMGGMGGGMGGGMFAVPDDLKLGPKSKQPAPTQPATRPVAKPAAQPAAAPQAKAGSAKPAAAIQLTIPAGVDPEAAWADYFAKHPSLEDASVRETARQLGRARKFNEVIPMLRAALRSKRPQPWMYEALSLAMQAAGSPREEIERALMSGVDFGGSTDDLMYVAQYMARSGLEPRALKVFRQVADLEPFRPEPYLYGLQLAEKLNDLEGIRWSSLGILKQAWPKERASVVDHARRSALAAVEELRSKNRVEEADELKAQIDKAGVRDCVVKVTWTGDADVDLMIVEPSGTVCEFRNPRTSGGGMLLGDSNSQDDRAAGEGTSETYECPEAFNGTYRVLIRRVWGKVTAGKVTVDVYAHYGTPEEKHLRSQIALGDQDAMVVFDLTDGRRKEPLAEQQLANAAAGQLAVNNAILAQQLSQISSSSEGATGSLGVARQGLFGGPLINQAVGYQPQIIVLPAGTSLSVSGVVSADRRYVRITPIPLFSGVSSVTTFNLVSGDTGTSTPMGGGTSPGGVPPGGGSGQF
jgi:hypothetical protein